MVKLINYWDRSMYLLFTFCFALLITLVGFKPALAQDDSVFIGAIEVVSLKDQIALCKNGVAVDFSTASNQRPIEVGDLLTAQGQFAPNENFTSLIKADKTFVRKLRDIQFIGHIQKLGTDELTILNQKLILTKDTKISDGELREGEGVIIRAENTAQGMKAFVIDIASFGKSISSAITSIEGNKLTIEGGYTVVLKDGDLEFLRLTDSYAIGASIIMALKKAPKTSVLTYKTNKLGPAYYSPLIKGKVQEVDLVNKTITIFNQKLKITDTTQFYDGDVRIDLNDLNESSVKDVVVVLGSSLLGNNFTVDYSIALSINLFR